MGMTKTPKYRVEVTTDNGYWTPQAWPSKYAGRPNAANLAAWVAHQEAATQPGQVNAHLGVTRILTAKIVRNAQDGDLVATFRHNRIACALCGTELVKHPDEPRTDPKRCAACARVTH